MKAENVTLQKARMNVGRGLVIVLALFIALSACAPAARQLTASASQPGAPTQPAAPTQAPAPIATSAPPIVIGVPTDLVLSRAPIHSIPSN
jgi:hypothetical protein